MRKHRGYDRVAPGGGDNSHFDELDQYSLSSAGRGGVRSGGGGDFEFGGGGTGTSNDDFVADHLSQQQTEMQRQDQSLSKLHGAVSRLGDMSIAISNELDEQNEMLDELDADVDRSQQAMEMITAKTKELVKQSGGCHMFLTIVMLSLVLVILVVLVLYT